MEKQTQQSASQPLPSVWSRNLVLVIIASLLFNASGQLLIPTLPVYVTELGIASSYAGIMTTAYTLGSLLFRPFAGQMVDTTGRRRMFLVGACIGTVACVLYSFAPNFPVLFGCRMLHGLGFCLVSTAVGTIAADVVPKERLTEGLGYYGIAGAVAQTAGPALGLALMGVLGIKPVFLLTAVVAFVAVLCGSQIKYKESRREVTAGEKAKLKLIEKNALLPASMIFFVSFTQCALTTFLALYGKEKNLIGVGNFFLINSVGVVTSRVFAGRLTRRFGEGKVLASACGISMLCFFMVSLANSNAMIFIAAMIYGFSYGILYPLCNGMSMRHVAGGSRGAATATFVGIFDLGTLTGTVVWGPLAAALGYAGMYRVAGLLMICIVLLYKFAFLRRYPEDAAL